MSTKMAPDPIRDETTGQSAVRTVNERRGIFIGRRCIPVTNCIESGVGSYHAVQKIH